jgi:hypothetical protein
MRGDILLKSRSYIVVVVIHRSSMKTETNRSYFNCFQANQKAALGHGWFLTTLRFTLPLPSLSAASVTSATLHKTIFKKWQNLLPVVLRMFNPFKNQSLHQKHRQSRPRLPLWRMLPISVKYNGKLMHILHRILDHPRSQVF